MDIRAEIITIGDEILWGQITDTNTQFISAVLGEAGVRPVHKTSVGDTAEAITSALSAALQRADIVLTTGGLGPTKDDITKTTLATYFGATLVEHPEAWVHLQSIFAARGRTINDLNRLQATLPSNAEYVQNEKGTAPGMWFTLPSGKVVVSMPGVPFEMKHMMRAQIIPRIQARFTLPTIRHHYLQTVGVPEAELAQLIAPWEDALPPSIKLAYLPSRGRVKLRLTASGEDEASVLAALQAEADKAVPLLGDKLFSQADEELEQMLARVFVANKLTLAGAESCTGGAFAQRITAWPGASLFFRGSAVVYDADAKIRLGVPQAIIDQHGVVSAECASALAVAANAFYQTDFAVSATGVAGPGLPTDVPPVGTIYIACAGPQGVVCRKLQLTQDRGFNIELAVVNMLNLVRQGLGKSLQS